ncbi:hypothetical protein GCM10023108_14780 [Saccharopolyspora hordei]
MGEIRIPVDTATTPGGLPQCCAAHGRVAVRQVDFALQSRVQVDGNRVLSSSLLGVADRIGERARRVKVARVRGWPLCRGCARRRSVLFGLSQLLFWGGLASIAAALLVRLIGGVQATFLGVLAFGGFIVALASVVPFVAGSLPRITRARTSDDGGSVIVEDPHPAFVAQTRG